MVGVPPPVDGDWYVNANTTVTDEDITLNGDIIVFNDAVLTLVNSTIRVNSTIDEEHLIVVIEGSGLKATNVVFTRAGEYDYGFAFDTGTTGFIEDSTVEHAGATMVEGMAIMSPDITINNTVFRNSTYGIALGAPATVTNSTLYNTTVGVLLMESLAGNDVFVDNTFTYSTFNNSEANVRYIANSTITVKDQDEDPVEEATVYLNNTQGQNVVENTTDANGQVWAGFLTVWEILPDNTNVSYEPFNLTALKDNKQNSTLVNPSSDPELIGIIEFLSDLVIMEEWVQWGDIESIVPAGRYNETEWRWSIEESPPDNWTEFIFDASDWDMDPAPFGDYQQGGVQRNTMWGYNNIAYFRHYFNIPDGISPVNAVFSVASDDYGTHYLNEQEIYSDWGSSHSMSYWNSQTDVNLSMLRTGEWNLLASVCEEVDERQWFDAQLDLTYIIPDPDTLAVGETYTLFIPIENQGVNSADDVDVHFYNNSNLLHTTTIDLDAGENTTVSFTWTPEERGNHTLRIEVDPGNDIKEEDESNNNISMKYYAGTFGVNMTVENNRTSTTFNQSTHFDLNVTNTGDISDNMIVEAVDLPSNWQAHIDPNPVPLEANESANVSMTIQPERGVDTGNYTFNVLAISSFQESESFVIAPSGQDNDTEYRWMNQGENDPDPSNWTKMDFDDSSWTWDPAPFGDSSGYNTEWDGNDRNAFFRHYFTMPTGLKVDGAILASASNDHGTYYLNEVEIFNDIDEQAHSYEYWNDETEFDQSILKPGEVNLIAAKVHNNRNQQWFDAEVRLVLLVGSLEEVTVEILPTHDFDLQSYSSVRNHPTNTTQYYPIPLTNFGHFDEEIIANLTVEGQTGDWTANLVSTSLNITSGSTDQFFIEVYGAPSLENDDVLNLSVELHMKDRSWINYTYYLNLTAEPPYHEFELVEYYSDEEHLNGTTVTYYIDINNLGNVQDTFVPTFEFLDGSGDWEYSFVPANVSVDAYSQGQLGIQVVGPDDLRFWDYLNLSVEIVIKEAPLLTRTYVLNLTPVFDDHFPPETGMVAMDPWVRNSTVTLEWEVKQDTDDTAYFYIYYQTEDTLGNMSDWTLWNSYVVDTTSDTIDVQHGWVYKFYCLGQDGSNNLEMDKQPIWETYFKVDLFAPSSKLYLDHDGLGPGVRKGFLNLTEVRLAWEPANLTAGDKDYSYTIETRNRSVKGVTWSDWEPILVEVSEQQGEYEVRDGHVYQFRSIAKDPAGWFEVKDGWNVQVTIDASAPMTGLVEAATITTTSDLTIDIDYEDIDDVDRLQVHYARFPEGDPPEEFIWRNGGLFLSGSLPPDISFSEMINGQRYLFRLASTDENGNTETRNDLVEYYVGNNSSPQTYQLGKMPLPSPMPSLSRVKVEVDEDLDGEFELRLNERFDRQNQAGKDFIYSVDYDTGIVIFNEGSVGYRPTEGVSVRITYDAYDAWTIIDTVSPGKPGNIHMKSFDVETGTAKISWHQTDPSISPDVMFYRLEHSTSKDGPWEEVATIPAPANNRDINDHLVEDLATDQAHYFRVIAIDRANQESNPNEIAMVNEQTVSDQDDDDGGTNMAMIVGILIVLIAFIAAMGFMFNRRQDPDIPTIAAPKVAAEGSQLVPVPEGDTGGAAMAVKTGGETLFEPVDGSNEFSCLGCGTFFLPVGKGKLTCPACSQTEDIPDDTKATAKGDIPEEEALTTEEEPIIAPGNQDDTGT